MPLTGDSAKPNRGIDHCGVPHGLKEGQIRMVIRIGMGHGKIQPHLPGKRSDGIGLGLTDTYRIPGKSAAPPLFGNIELRADKMIEAKSLTHRPEQMLRRGGHQDNPMPLLPVVRQQGKGPVHQVLTDFLIEKHVAPRFKMREGIPPVGCDITSIEQFLGNKAQPG